MSSAVYVTTPIYEVSQIEIIKSGRKAWQVFRQGADRFSSSSPTKAEAMARATTLAKKNQGIVESYSAQGILLCSRDYTG